MADQPLVSVETEKAVVEIPSPQAGHIARLLAAPGERVKVGAPLLEFEEGPHAETGTVVGELAKPSPTTAVAPSAAGIGGRGGSCARDARRCARAPASSASISSRVTPSGTGRHDHAADVTSRRRQRGTPAEPLRGARRTMALNMARAWREVVHATLHDEADVEGWAAAGGRDRPPDPRA